MSKESLELRRVLRMVIHIESMVDGLLIDPDPVLATLSDLQTQLSDEIIHQETGGAVEKPQQKDERR